MLSRVRKAAIAGVTAGLAAALAVLAKSGWSLDQTTIIQAAGAFAVAGLAAAYATWRVPNAPATAPYSPR